MRCIPRLERAPVWLPLVPVLPTFAATGSGFGLGLELTGLGLELTGLGLELGFSAWCSVFRV